MNLQLTKQPMKSSKSHSYNQNKLKIICDKLCDRIEELMEVLSIENIKYNGKMFVGNCPIHNGDNKTALNLYPDGEFYRGNWKCRTHNCEKIFKSSIIGFVRGVLSNKKYGWQKDKDQAVTFEETISFIESFLGSTISSIEISKNDIDKKRFLSVIKNIISNKEILINKISKTKVKDSLIFPCEYFIKRGFSEKILEKYDVGLCLKPDKEMYNRAVVPIYDYHHQYMIGCTGRIIFDKCEKCKTYHPDETACPNDSNKNRCPKWKHSYGFLSENCLYNMWFAKDFILNSTKVIIVESPGNVWKLEESGIHNSVAIFGCSLSDRQKILLDGSGAMNIITIMDNDDAGKIAEKTIYEKCKNTYNITNIKISKSDIAEMSVEDIQKEIKPYI
jgi:5S rRNA maturation endonuclease (ribonuclease M5)